MTIHSSVFKVAQEAANGLINQGTTISAKNGTPLAELAGKITVYETNDFSASEDYEATRDGFADFIAERMAATMDFTRNTVQPAIELIQTKVAEAIKAISYDPFAGLTIEEVSYPEVLADDRFMSGLQHYHSGSSVYPGNYPKLQPKTDTEILELMSTGNADWDAKVKTWVTSLPEGHLQNVWQSVFQDKAIKSGLQLKSLETVLKDFNEGHYSALAVFLLASSLKNNITDDFQMSLDEARAWCHQICQLSAGALITSVSRYNSIVATGSLVTGLDNYSNKVSVNKALYKEFLQAGGKVDVLYGLLVSGGKYRSIKDIQANEEALLKNWAVYSSSREAEALTSFASTVKLVMISAFEEEITNPISDVEKEELNNSETRQKACSLFRQYIEEASKGAIADDWVNVLWRAVAKARFHYNTTSYEIIDIVDYEVSKGADPKDASTVALETVVARFVAEMVSQGA